MTRRPNRPRALALAALLLALTLAPTAAFAAPGAPLERADLQFDPGTTTHGSILIITGTLPDSTPLPATIRIPIPQGSTVRWAGEILGGPLEDDPAVQPAIEHADNGYDIASLTLTTARRGQIELDAPAMLAEHGTSRVVNMAWTPVDEVGTISLMTALPAGATVATFTPGATTGPGPANGTLISLETSGAPGTEAVLQATYEVAAAAPVAGPQKSDTAGILIFAGVTALLVLAGIAIARRTRQGTETPGSAEETDALPESTTDSADAPAAAHSPTTDTDVTDETPEPAQASAAPRRFTPQVVILVVVAIVLGGAVFMMASGETPGTTRTTDEYAYRVLTDADADTTATFSIVLSEADPAHESSHVFDAVSGVQGVRSVKVLFSPPGVEIEYDSSAIDEATISAALAAGGYPPR